MLKHNQKISMCKAMVTFGGGFVGHLAECFYIADSDNQRRLEDAFPEYVKKYLEIARLERDYLGINYDIDGGG
jgi:hypothetical protein